MVGLSLFIGCANEPYQRYQTYGWSSWGIRPLNQHTVVNNSGYRLKVYCEGQLLSELGVGDVLPVSSGEYYRRTVITVTGYDVYGNYVGADTWIFDGNVPEAWAVTQLMLPKRPQ